jgi:hypothetical protein
MSESQAPKLFHVGPPLECKGRDAGVLDESVIDWERSRMSEWVRRELSKKESVEKILANLQELVYNSLGGDQRYETQHFEDGSARSICGRSTDNNGTCLECSLVELHVLSPQDSEEDTIGHFERISQGQRINGSGGEFVTSMGMIVNRSSVNVFIAFFITEEPCKFASAPFQLKEQA